MMLPKHYEQAEIVIQCAGRSWTVVTLFYTYNIQQFGAGLRIILYSQVQAMTQKGSTCNTQISVEKNKVRQRKVPIMKQWLWGDNSRYIHSKIMFLWTAFLLSTYKIHYYVNMVMGK